MLVPAGLFVKANLWLSGIGASLGGSDFRRFPKPNHRRGSCAVTHHGGERAPGPRTRRTAASRGEDKNFAGSAMSQSPPAPPSLEVLRREIDAIDVQVHGLLMQRGDIIDRL